MGNPNPVIHDHSYDDDRTITPGTRITSGGAPSTEKPKEVSKGYSGVSQIEESKNVTVESTVPVSGQPQLTTYRADSAALLGQVISVAGGPSVVVDFLHEMANRMGKVTNDMLDAWNKSIKDQAERVRELINSPHFQELNQIQKGRDGSGPDNLSVAPTILAVMVVGTSLVMSANPAATIASGSNSPLQAVSQVSSDMQTVVPHAFNISDILDVNLMVPLMQISMETAILKTKGQPTEMQFANSFAQEVIKMIATPGWMQLTVIRNIPGAEKLDPKGQAQLVAVMKLTMALTAFALLYKAEAGGLTAQEIIDKFRGMMSGKIPVKEGTAEGTLVTMMKAQLQVLDPATKEKALVAMMAALDNPNFVKNLDKMNDPVKTFENVFDNLEFDSADNIRTV